jgi:hypothetical protein
MLKMDMGMMSRCMNDCGMCMSMCMETMMTRRDMAFMTPEMGNMLQDCAAMCEMSMGCMMRGSQMCGKVCAMCAEMCSMCADMCMKTGGKDEMMMRCAEMCKRCAESCNMMARMVMAA